MQPGDPIVECYCPCCGAFLDVTIGDDEGIISVVGTPTTETLADREEMLATRGRAIAFQHIQSIMKIDPSAPPADVVAYVLALQECARKETQK